MRINFTSIMIVVFRKFLLCGDAVPIDLNILSLHRLNGQEQSRLPGLASFAPPSRAARGRERETLLVALTLNGNIAFSDEEYAALTRDAAAAYYAAHGALTGALRAAAEKVNRALLERNLASSGRGQYVVGLLTLAALRDSQLTILQCGPTHVVAAHAGEARRLHDPALAGKGLGLSQNISRFFSQVSLQPGDRLLLCPALPPAWETALALDRGLPAPDAVRKRLMAIADGDVSGAFILVTEGTGSVGFIAAGTTTPPATPRPVEASSAADSAPATPPPASESTLPPAHIVGRVPDDAPSAYAIPPQPPADDPIAEQFATAPARTFPPSIPRARPLEPEPAAEIEEVEEEEPEFEAVDVSTAPPEERAARRAEAQRRAARVAVGGLQTWRRVRQQVWERIRKFLPHLLPGGESDISLPIPAMTFISILVPLLVVTIAVMVYARFGVSAQHNALLTQARVLRQQAMQETDLARKRESWDGALEYATRAEDIDKTSETQSLRQEAQTQLDALLGVTRLRFAPAFSAPLNAQISRMAVSDSDLYMLDATDGKILRAAIDRAYALDEKFICGAGIYGSVTVGSLVDLLVLPKANMLNSSVLGVDAAGNLLYCAPGQTPRLMTLPLPPTYWKHVTAIWLDGGNLSLDGADVKLKGARLYVLDAPARAIWVYTDTEGVFMNQPLTFFGDQIPEIQDAIDVVVSGDDLYLLHADGRITYCKHSWIDGIPTRCQSPVKLENTFPAYGNEDVFAKAHFTQMILTGQPDTSLLLLDADGQTVYRIGARDYKLQGIFAAPPSVFPAERLGALTFSPSRVLYLASGGQVYFASETP